MMIAKKLKVCLCLRIPAEIVLYFVRWEMELFMICIVCHCVYTILVIYPLDKWRGVLPLLLLCNFGLLRTDAISVPGVVQDVPLHKRFPHWCRPVISFLAHNIMRRCGVPHNMFHLRGPTMSCVSIRPHSQAVMFFNTPKLFSLVVWSERMPFALLHQVLFEYSRCRDILCWDIIIYKDY